MSAGSIDVWGPAMWRFLHAASFAWGDAPDPDRKRDMIVFLRSIGTVLPCATCRRHYQEYVQKHLTEEDVASRDSLSRWVWALHNNVNRRLGKREWSLEQLKQTYEAPPAAPFTAARVFKWIFISLVAALLILTLLRLSGVRGRPSKLS